MQLLSAVTIFGAAIAGVDAKSAIPFVTLGKDVNGKNVDLPLIGAGTWQYNDTIAYDSVCKAFAAGYNFVDTANGYGNEKGVGQAIKDCWKGSREELFVMTKIPGGLNASAVQAAHVENMKLLQLDYVDHLMTHFPGDWGATPALSNPAMRREEWGALEAIYGSGEARSIGVSHYSARHIADILETATVRPTVNQVEWHVGAGDIDNVIAKCKEEQIYFMSFSPLCGPCDYNASDSLISGDLVTSIGKAHGVSGSQVSLRWVVQQAMVAGDFIAGAIPKSDNAEHLASNLDVFGFELTADEMAQLSAATLPAATGGDADVP